MTTEPYNKRLTALVEKAKDDDRHAMESIIKRFHPRIFTMVLTRVKNREDAMDLTQDIFIIVCKKIKHLKSSDKFKSWLFRITYNKVKDFYKKKKILAFFGLAKDYERLDKNRTPDQETGSNGFRDSLKELTAGLTQVEKEIFMLKYLDDLTIKEIAAILDKNQSTVKTHLYRSLGKIRKNKATLNSMLGN